MAAAVAIVKPKAGKQVSPFNRLKIMYKYAARSFAGPNFCFLLKSHMKITDNSLKILNHLNDCDQQVIPYSTPGKQLFTWLLKANKII